MKTLISLIIATTVLFTNTAHGHNHGYHNTKADIVETASNAGQFQTLLTAARAAGLVDALKGDGPLTVFAPTDDAFGALPAGTIDALLRPEN